MPGLAHSKEHTNTWLKNLYGQFAVLVFGQSAIPSIRDRPKNSIKHGSSRRYNLHNA